MTTFKAQIHNSAVEPDSTLRMNEKLVPLNGIFRTDIQHCRDHDKVQKYSEMTRAEVIL